MIRGARLATNLLLALVVFRVWHILLLRLFLDQPLAVAGWLAAVLGLVILARGLANTVPPDRRRFPEQLWVKLDGPGLTFLAFFLCLAFLFHWGFERAGSDGREYFVQIRSLVIDRDLDFQNENATFGVRGTASRYAFGATVLWVPFFVLCHAWLGLLNLFGGHFNLDGFGSPYQRAIGLGTLVYGFVGLVLIYRILSDYFSRQLATVTVLLLCCGSFLVWYLTVENSMVHGVSMFSTTLFLFYWYRTRGNRTRLQWGLLGAAAGLMSMVRWQNVLFMAVPVIHALAESWRARRGQPRAARTLVDASVLAACAVAAFSPQFVFWRVVRGAWISPPAQEHGVHLTSLHIGDVLFSSNHGLLSWTPLLYLALLGLPFFFRRDRTLATVLVAGFLAQVFINSAVEVWWGGSGFGARRFANCALVFGIGLASMLDWLRRRPFVAPGVIVGTLVFANAAFMLDVKSTKLPSGEGVTFDQIQDSLYTRLGNPFSFPKNAVVAWKYQVSLPVYDKLKGRTYNNLTIDLGESDDDGFLGPGWSVREREPGYSFRWATGLQSIVLVPLKEADDYQLDLQCAAFRYPGARSRQTVEVLANRHSVGRLVIDQGGSHTIRIPARFLQPDLNQILFRYTYATSPAEAGLSADARPLAMMCDTLRFTRLLTK